MENAAGDVRSRATSFPADRLGRRRAAAAGAAVLSVAAVLAGIASSYGGHPDYHPLVKYVSQLAEPENPRWAYFCAGLIAGGPLLVLFTRLASPWIPNRQGRVGFALASVAGAFMTLVGFFPLTHIVPHFACAAILFATAMFAELYLAKGLAVLATDLTSPRLRAASRAMFGVFGVHIAGTVAGFTYSAIASRDMPIVSPEQMLRDAPSYQTWHVTPALAVNPPAILEWVFLITTMALLLLSAAGLVIEGRQRRQPMSTQIDKRPT